MNIFSNFFNLFREVNSYGIIGFSIIEIFFFYMFISCFYFKRFFCKYNYKKVKKIISKSSSKIDDNIFDVLIHLYNYYQLFLFFYF